MHLRSLILPLVSFNSIDDQALFVGFSMCDFLMFREMISKFTVEHLEFSYVLMAISPYRPPSRPNATTKGATLTTGFVQEGVEVLSPKEILKNYLKSYLGKNDMELMTQLRMIRDISLSHCWSPPNPPTKS